MKIIAKIINEKGDVSDVELDSDPSDFDISKALGSNSSVSSTVIATVRNWEIHSLINGKGDFLVIGGAPYISDDPKSRLTCDLPDDKVRKLCEYIRCSFDLLS